MASRRVAAWRGRSLHPAVATAARAIIAEARADGIPARVTSGYRSIAKQRQLYNAYRRGGPLAAAPGSSSHNFGLAVDIAIAGAARDDRRYAKLHRIGRKHGLEPLDGEQRRVDPYHLQLPNWRSLVTTPRSR